MSSIFQETPDIREQFIPPTPEEITLLAFNPNVNNEILSDVLCKEIVDCGFNAVGATITYDDIPGSLENCYNNGLSLFMRNESMMLYTKQYVSNFKDSKGLGGWVMRPYMSPSVFKDEEQETLDYLKKAYDGVCETDINHDDLGNENKNRNHPIILGLAGDWNVDNHYKPIESYPDYIANVQKTFRPMLWSYMYFPDLVLPGSDVVPEERRKMFYKDLQYFAYVSRYTASPFWVFCRSMGFQHYYGWQAPDPTEFSIRGIVFSALAYGAQGILYWTYRQPVDSNVEYSGAPVDSDGNITPFWHRLRMVNQEVKAFNDVFYGCEMVDCRHLFNGDSEGLKLFTHPTGPLMDIKNCENGCSAPGRDLLISQIFNKGKDGKGKNYIVIVADPFTKGCERITLQFNKYWKVTELKLTSHSEYIEVPVYEDYIHVATLSQGDYLIFRWE